jgi:hypothetical protein
MEKIKGFKGFNKDLMCRDKQYAIGKEEVENVAQLCKGGLHFCENPHDVFNYYAAGNNNRFCEVEAAEVSEEKENDSKRVAKRLFVKNEISVFHICKIAVSTFFENFGFKYKIGSADTNTAGDCGAANAGNYGAASVKENGVAISSTGGKVKGGKGSVLVLVNRDDDCNVIDSAMAIVDGTTILPDT